MEKEGVLGGTTVNWVQLGVQGVLGTVGVLKNIKGTSEYGGVLEVLWSNRGY